MSAPAYKINDRRSSSGWTNTLYQAAMPNTDAPLIPRLDRDQNREITNFGWRQLLSASRFFVENSPTIKGGIEQMVTYAIGTGFNVQYEGRNKEWGNKMEEAVGEFDKVSNVRGYPFDFRTDLVNDLRSLIRDGDAWTLLTENSESQWPAFQSIPAHRIGNMIMGPRLMESGEYSGSYVLNGVIQNDVGRAIAFQVFQDYFAESESVNISSNDLKMTFWPQYYEQARGIPWLSAAINDMAKIKAIREFLMVAIEAESAHTILETNETGSPTPSTKSLFASTPTASNPTAPTVQNLSGGVYRYLKSGSGKLESLKSDRPHTNVMDFQFEVLRGIFESLGWPIEFYNPQYVGGATSRQRIAQAKRTLERIQYIANRLATMKHVYAIAKLIKLGVLEPDIDWWKISHQTPRDITVDNGRDIKALMELYLRGIITQQELCAENAEYWEDVQDQRIREEKRFQDECAKAGVDPNNIRTVASTSSQQIGEPVQQQQSQDQSA